MAVWELALVIFAVTYLMVNTVVLITQLKFMSEMKGVFSKSIKFMEKMIDNAGEQFDEMFGKDKEE